jgi:tetratricopeptide (TPR) repeat protein
MAHAQSAAETGMKAMEANRWEDAENAFSRAVAEDPSDFAARFHLALAQTFLNKDEAAIAGFQKALDLKPGLYEAHLNLGLLLFRYRRFEEAAKHLEEAAGQKPADVRALFHAAESHRELKRCPVAEPRYRQVLALDASLVAAELGLARCLAQSGRLGEAAPLFEKAQAWPDLAQAYEDAGQLEKALPIWERLREDLPILTRLAAAYLKTGDAAKAEAAVAKALALAPEDYDLRLTYGRMLRDKKQLAAAAGQFAKASQIKPAEPAPLNELAGMLISLEDYGRALAVLDRLRQMGAETPGHLFFRAIVLDKNRQVKPALEAYRQFLATSGGKYPDEEFKARQRARILEREAARR